MFGQDLELDQEAASVTLEQFVQRVLRYNETTQMRLLELEIARREHKATQGVFEPELVLGFDHVDTKRQNSTEQSSSQGVNVYEGRNNVYTGGLESLVPSGARVRLGYTVSDLRNNLGLVNPGTFFSSRGAFIREYQSFLGLNITQPLLKNFGPSATLSEIRIAAMANEVAFQEYRKQLLETVTAAEAAYWNLYLAQQQLLFFRESVALAETILKDNRTRAEAGRGAELDVLEAASGLGLRKSRQQLAWENYYQAVSRMATLASGSMISTNPFFLAADEPAILERKTDMFQSWQAAFESNPDYLIQRQRVLQENVRLAFSKNQRLPQLDLKASYGLNGLGNSPADAWDDVERGRAPAWSVGLELRLPLEGGTRARHLNHAVQLRRKRALLGLKEIETQVVNALDTAIRKVSSSRDTVASYEATVHFNESLLKSQLARLELGNVESRKVFEVEEDLFEAKNAVVEAKVAFRRALLELGLIEGSVLQAHNIDFTRADLQGRTAQLVRDGTVTEEQYQRVLHDVQLQYERTVTPASLEDQQRARQILKDESERLQTRTLSTEEYQKALQLLQEESQLP